MLVNLYTKGWEKEMRKQGRETKGRGEKGEKSCFHFGFFLWEIEIICCLSTSVGIDRLQKNMA